MNKLLLGGLIASCMSLGSLAEAEKATSWKDDVKGWDIFVDTSLSDNCFMTTLFDGDTFLRIQMRDPGEGIDLYIGDADWASLEVGKTYPIKVKFGNQTPWDGNAKAVSFGDDALTALRLGVGDENAVDFAVELMESTAVYVSYQGRELAHLNLRGSYAAMMEVFECQKTMNQRNNRDHQDPFSEINAGDDPFL